MTITRAEIESEPWIGEQRGRVLALIDQRDALLAALEALVWPNVPSGDEVRLLMRMVGGTSESAERAIEMADRLAAAQDIALAAIAKARGP